MSNEEKYEKGYAEGYRIGFIMSKREMLIRYLNLNKIEQGEAVSKLTIQKINRETDHGFLTKVLIELVSKKISISELENQYDKIFRTDEEIRCEQYTVYDKKE